MHANAISSVRCSESRVAEPQPDNVVPLAQPSRGFDFVEGFLDLTDGISSPEVYRLWAGISCVAAALERRVWIETSQGVMFPNLYVMLVGAPGVGKDRPMNYIEKLFDDVPALHTAPNSMTAASMLDDFEHVHRTVVRDGKLVAEYHSMLVLANEFAVFCPGYELDFLGRLNYIYDNPRRLRVSRKYISKETGKKEINLGHPQLNILAGAQPGLLATLLPEEAWSSGTMSRMIMIYASSGPTVDLFGQRIESDELYLALRSKVSELSRAWGRMWWEKDAARALNDWHMSGGTPRPTHSKLTYYCNRRTTLHAPKLAMISAASRSNELRVTSIDVDRAIAWLVQAESLMPDIFREMVGKSDGEVIRELHFFMWRIYTREKKALHESRLINFLKDRVPHEKILRIIEIAERANIISRGAGTALYVPKPTADHGFAE